MLRWSNKSTQPMNALVKKEIRLLLPSFLIGVALTFLNAWFKPNNPLPVNAVTAFVAVVGCAAIAVFMALNAFGAEISGGTFSMLLAQPVARAEIWRTKTRVLAAALLLGGISWCAILFCRFQVFSQPQGLGDFWDIFRVTWIFLAVIYSGALWTVLLLRQVAAAFWFTLLTPGAIVMVVTGPWLEKYPDICKHVAVAVLLLYSVAGFWFARRLFLRAQDVAWTGGNIVWPTLRGAGAATGGAAEKRRWRPRAALFGKEWQLHQSQCVLAGVLALLHLGVLAVRKFGSFQRNSATEFILEIFWGLWLVLPLLVGAAAAAEERRLGTLAGQLCLPVKRRTQFAIKFRMVLLLSALFGWVLPLLFEGSRIMPGIRLVPAGFPFENGVWMLMNNWQSYFWFCLGWISNLAPVLALLGAAIVIGSISFYASTLSRNTLQALAPAVLGLMVFVTLLFNAEQPEFFFGYPLWHGGLIYLLGVPAGAVALVAMSFWNCQRLDLGGAVWGRNALVLASSLALVIGATTAIYHRAWEKLTPFEPAHGAARLSAANPPVMLGHEYWNTFSVRLPDGRIWANDYLLNFNVANLRAWLLGDIGLTSAGKGHFLEGSNWVSMLSGPREQQTGIKSDGTLWVTEKPTREDRWQWSGPGHFQRFGDDTNWSSLSWSGASILLVKTDGTLWRWGPQKWRYQKSWPRLQSFTPYRLGTESNWAEVFAGEYQQPVLRKTDGELWTTWITQNINQQTNELEPGFGIARWPLAERTHWRSTATAQLGLGYRLGVGDDGTLRLYADQKLAEKSNSYEWTAVDFQFGTETNWLAVAGGGQKVVTLKDDGTLWLWNFHHDNRRGWDTARDEREMLAQSPVRLGTHTDWIVIAGSPGGIITLAADGSLWYWPLEEFRNLISSLPAAGGFWDSANNEYLSFAPLLDISRKPQPLGNLFGQAD
jgi:hypothetical protein